MNKEIEAEKLRQLDEAGIPYEYRKMHCKYYAVIDLKNDRKALYCPFTNKINYLNKTYNIKTTVPNWFKANKLEVK